MTARTALVAAWVSAGMLLAGTALADKVAVLPFQAVSGATSADLDASRAATRTAVTALAHKLPTDAEMLTAQMSSKDGVADTGEGVVFGEVSRGGDGGSERRVDAPGGRAGRGARRSSPG